MGLQILQKICSFKGQKKGKTSSPTEVFKNLFKCDWKRPEHLKAGLFFVVIYKKQVKETIRKQKENNERTAGFFFSLQRKNIHWGATTMMTSNDNKSSHLPRAASHLVL